MAEILIAGFDPATESKLSEKIAGMGYQLKHVGCDVLFTANIDTTSGVIASADDVRCTRWLRRLREGNSQVPFVLIGRVADDASWISALESGATDYCPVDVDLANLAWILQNAMGRTYHLTSAA